MSSADNMQRIDFDFVEPSPILDLNPVHRGRRIDCPPECRPQEDGSTTRARIAGDDDRGPVEIERGERPIFLRPHGGMVRKAWRCRWSHQASRRVR
ncbi:hypothetical protein [Aureimonas pseudogalii]|uniref:Uncharacterized protein n=1 Tax=Aureimonas pseudogalii TaxID=1744844 RepID=A0A7W6H6C4_9HYPH|nr:hypothetical protein [Aureimonas pseudogalii]MBB3999410.1 hypothetical protein [Aureimonas pseudogalii]